MKEETLKIPDKHKELVRERIKQSEENPQRLVEWDEVKDNFKFNGMNAVINQ